MKLDNSVLNISCLKRRNNDAKFIKIRIFDPDESPRWIHIRIIRSLTERIYPFIHICIYIFERMGNINNGIQASVSSFVAQ